MTKTFSFQTGSPPFFFLAFVSSSSCTIEVGFHPMVWVTVSSQHLSVFKSPGIAGGGGFTAHNHTHRTERGAGGRCFFRADMGGCKAFFFLASP